MRMMMKVSIPVEAGNAGIRDGSLVGQIQAILEEAKPESAYFAAQDGMRTGFLVVNMDDSSQLPGLAEPWWLAFNASVESFPVMSPDDLQRAGPAIESAIKKYG
jgi:hypothetical protein